MPWAQRYDFARIFGSGGNLNRIQEYIAGEDNQIIHKVSIGGYRNGSIRLCVYARNSEAFNQLNAGMGNPVFKPNHSGVLNELSILTLDKRLMGFFLKKLSNFQPDFPVQAVCQILDVNLDNAYTEQEVAILPAEQAHIIVPQSLQRPMLRLYHNPGTYVLNADEAFNQVLQRSFNETNHSSNPPLLLPEREDPDPEEKLSECEGFKQEWICPIDLMIMTDPVYFPTLANKQCFQRSSMEAYLGEYKTHPITKEPITIEMMASNPNVKTAIDNFIETNKPKPKPN